MLAQGWAGVEGQLQVKALCFLLHILCKWAEHLALKQHYQAERPIVHLRYWRPLLASSKCHQASAKCVCICERDQKTWRTAFSAVIPAEDDP